MRAGNRSLSKDYVEARCSWQLSFFSSKRVPPQSATSVVVASALSFLVLTFNAKTICSWSWALLLCSGIAGRGPCSIRDLCRCPHGAQRRSHGGQRKGYKERDPKERAQRKKTIFIDGCPSMNINGFPVLWNPILWKNHEKTMKKLWKNYENQSGGWFPSTSTTALTTGSVASLEGWKCNN